MGTCGSLLFFPLFIWHVCQIAFALSGGGLLRDSGCVAGAVSEVGLRQRITIKEE